MHSIVDLFYDDVDLTSLDNKSFNKLDDFLKWSSDSESGFIVNASEIDFSDKDLIKQFIYDSCKKIGVKMGNVMPGLRLALVGGVAGPDLITTLSILGKSESRKRVANLMMFVLEKQVEMFKND
jgi:glutamyl/glutaminyl-tRNA synthetase